MGGPACIPELLPLVRDEVPGIRSGLPYGMPKESSDCERSGLLVEHGEAHEPAGVVIDCDRQPPAERPLLGQGEGQPRGPETQRRGDRGQIDMPNVVRLSRSYDSSCPLDLPKSPSSGWFVEKPSDRRRAEMQPGSAENLGDLDSAHRRTEHLEPAHDVAHEIGEAIHRITDLNDGPGALLIQTMHPRGDRGRRDEKPAGRLRQGPTAGCSKLEDGEPLDGWIVGPTLGRRSAPSGSP